MSSAHALPARPSGARLLPLGAVAASAGAGSVLAVLDVRTDVALVAAVAAVLLLPLAVRVAQRRLDVFEPIVTATIALFVMYVARPAALLADGRTHTFKGYDVSGQFRHAIVLVLLGVVALELGYAAPLARRTVARLAPPRDRWDVDMTVVFALGLAALGLGLFGIFLLQAGGWSVLTVMLHGRSSAQLPFFDRSSAYFWAGPQLLWPASLLLVALGIGTRRRGFVATAVLLMLPLAVFAGAQGSRIVLLPLLAAPALLYFLATGRRPKVPALLLAAYLFFTIGIAYFRETRTAGDHVSRVAQVERSLTDPGYEYRQLVFDGVDNDMFESLAAELNVVPSRLPIAPLDFVLRTAAKPIPSIVWKGKPYPPEEELTRVMYPREVTRASSSAALIGNLFQLGGTVGVLVGMFVTGWLLRLPWEYFRRFRRSATAQLLLTACTMFIPILLRGAIGETLANALFALVPLAAAARICQRRAGAAA